MLRPDVVAAVLSLPGANHSDFVHSLRHEGHFFANERSGHIRCSGLPQAPHFHGSIRLRIECFVLAGPPARNKKMQETSRFLCPVAGACVQHLWQAESGAPCRFATPSGDSSAGPPVFPQLSRQFPPSIGLRNLTTDWYQILLVCCCGSRVNGRFELHACPRGKKAKNAFGKRSFFHCNAIGSGCWDHIPSPGAKFRGNFS